MQYNDYKLEVKTLQSFLFENCSNVESEFNMPDHIWMDMTEAAFLPL